LSPTFVYVVLIVAQALTATVLGALLHRFHRQYSRPYLRYWSLAFAALAAVLLLTLAQFLALPRWLDELRSALVLAAVYLQILWFVVGIHEASGGRGAPVALLSRTAWLLVVFGVASGLVLFWDPAATQVRYALRSALPYLASLTAFGLAGALLLRSRVARDGMGARLLGIALLAAALEHAVVLGSMFLVLDAEARTRMSIGVSIVDLMISVFVGFGMGIWLLEDERRSAALASREVAHLAYHDALTGLPNRRLLLDRLEQAIAQAKRASEKVVVIFMDLDRFKVINDSLGHSVGDELLCAAATRLRHRTRGGDTIARIGGDEFALIFPRVSRAADAVQVADNLLRTIRAPFSLAGRELFVTTSLGLAFFPDDGGEAETLLRHADLAMYRAKEEGRNNFQLFVPQMKEHAVERLELEHELRRACAERELAIHFQPVVEMRGERVCCVEALVRWPHRGRGMIMPDRFLPVAEQLGLLVGIDEWVLRQACLQVRDWQRRHRAQLSVAVNLSARTIQQPELPFMLQQVLTESDLHPSQLIVEVTERTALHNVEVGSDTLNQLRQLGVGVAIDDFGTGYSSLSYLRHLPASVLKIDKSFVGEMLRDGAARAIVQALVPLARSLKLQVVAEGVESPEQRDALRDMGVDHAQGWLYHRALEADEVDRLLESGAAR
jgi:diguanylate cyclase (GGDEF)-like protein